MRYRFGNKGLAYYRLTPVPFFPASLMSHEGIIHGDVKPENALIFFQNDGRLVAKVTDFGYSTLFATERDLVRMPDSGIWTAPERHHREFFPEKARKLDVYSFGMLCLWLLCYNKESQTDHSFRQDFKDSSVKGITSILENSGGLLNEDRHGVQKLFSLTLTQDPDQRPSNFNELLPFLSSNR